MVAKVLKVFALPLLLLGFQSITPGTALATGISHALSAQAMRNAENATVLITGYVDIVSGCTSNGTSPTLAFDAKRCAKSKDSSISRVWYRCAGVADGIADQRGFTIQVLTARHCIEPTKRLDDGEAAFISPEQDTIAVQFRNGDTGRYAGTIAGSPTNYDVVSIRVATRRPHLIVAQPGFAITPGEPLHVLGHCHDFNWGWKDADSLNGTQASAIADWSYTSMVDCPQCNEGDSGGGVWSNDGKLVGIFNAITAQFGLFTPVTRISQVNAAAPALR